MSRRRCCGISAISWPRGAWCATGGDGVEGEWSRAEIEEHVRDEHSTFTWLIEPMLAHARFEISEVTRSADGFESAYVLRAI